MDNKESIREELERLYGGGTADAEPTPQSETPEDKDTTTGISLREELNNLYGDNTETTKTETTEDRKPLLDHMALTSSLRDMTTGEGLKRTHKKIENAIVSNPMHLYSYLSEDEEGNSNRGEALRKNIEQNYVSEGDGAFVKAKYDTASKMVDMLPAANDMGDIEIDGYTYPRARVVQTMADVVEETMHPTLMKSNKAYRDNFSIATYGKNFNDYLRERLLALDHSLSKMQQDVNRYVQEDVDAISSQTPIYARGMAGGIDPVIAAAIVTNEKSGGRAIRDTRDKIRSIIDDDFGSGFNESFDWGSMASMGLNDIIAGAELNAVLNKAKDGKELSEREQTVYDVWAVNQELDDLRDITGRSGWNSIGSGVGVSAEFAPSMMLGTGLLGGGVKLTSLGVKAGFRAAKNAAQKGVMNGIKRGLIETAKVAGRAAANVTRAEAVGIISAPLTPTTWARYAEKRAEQYALNGDKVEYKPTEVWKDVADVMIEQANEVAGELTGGRIADVIGSSAKVFGRTLRLDRIADKIGISADSRTFLGLRKPAYIREFQRNIGFAGPIAEPLSEVWGDVASNIMKGAITGNSDYSQLATPDYWSQVIGVSTIYGGAVSLATTPASIMEYKRSGIYGVAKARQKSLSQIGDDKLRNEMLSISSIEDMDEAARELANISWKDYKRTDVASAMEFIRADYMEKVMLGDAKENVRMSQFEPIALSTSSLVYCGEDGATPTDEIISIDTDMGRLVVRKGVIDTGFDNMLECIDANGQIIPVHSSKIKGVYKHSLQDELAANYEKMFGTQIEVDRQNEIVENFKAIKKPTAKDVNIAMSQFGVLERADGDVVTLTDGRTGVINSSMGDGTYAVAVSDYQGTQLLSVPFYDILAEDAKIKDAQMLGYAERMANNIDEYVAGERYEVTKEEKAEVAKETETAETTTRNGITEGDVVATKDGRQGRVIAINDDGTYTIDENVDNISNDLDAAMPSVINESDITTGEEIPIDDIAEETMSAEGDIEAAPIEEMENIPTLEDGTIDYNAISDPKVYAKHFANDMGGNEAASAQMASIITAAQKEIDDLTAKKEASADPNEAVRNAKAIAERKQRLAFYNEVMNVLSPTPSPEVTAVETTTEQPKATTEVYGIVPNIHSAKLEEGLAKVVDAMAKALGLRVVFTTGLKGDAEIVGNEVRMDWGHRTKAVSFLAGHEFTHRMQDLSPEAYEEFKQSVKDYLGEDEWNRRMVAQARKYRYNRVRYTKGLLEDECIADFAGQLVEGKDVFANYLNKNKDNKGLLSVIADVLRAIRDFIFNADAEAAKPLNATINSLESLIDAAAEKQSASSEAQGNKDNALREGVMQGQPKFSLRDVETEKIFATAKAKFGTTYDMREAGYILPDGSMLDFSGRHQVRGGDTSFLNGDRTVDHREISDIAYDNDDNETGINTDLGDFLDRGAIRIDSNAGAINLNVAPTKAQKDRLKRLIERNEGYVYIDFGKGWDTEHYAEYEAARASRVLGDIDRYFDEGIKPTGNVHFSLREVNNRFNEELATLTEENKDKVILSLGIPSEKLLAGGVVNKPMKLYGAKVMKKQKLHGFNLSEIKNLPLAVANPIAVFNNYQSDENRSVLTELTTKDGDFLVSLNVGKGEDIDFNIVATLFGKGDDNIVDWFNRGLATYIDKEKALDYLHHSALNAEALSNPRLVSTANIIQNFQNPKIEAKNTLITPEMDASYLDAVERGDMATAQKMVMEAAKLAMPNTKVVDDDGNPKVVYHYSNKPKIRVFNPFRRAEELTGVEIEKLGKIRESFNEGKRPLIRPFMGIWATPIRGEYADYGKYEYALFADIRNPRITDRISPNLSGNKNADGVFSYSDDVLYEVSTILPERFKSADPVTYDDAGNVIPLSERFSPEKEDIRYSLSAPTFYSNAEYAVRNIKQEKATPEQWLKMIEKAGGLKAGEDKWLGLSDWLKASTAKTLTKDEVLQYIAENDIQIEEVVYYDEGRLSSYDITESDEFSNLLTELTEYDEDENPSFNVERFRELQEQDKDFAEGFELDYWGESIEVNDPVAAARYLGLMQGNGEIIHRTRLDYTTQGLSNKREIALVVPTIEPYNAHDEIHFGDAGEGRAVAWVRFGEAEVPKNVPMHQRVDGFDAPFKNVAGYDVYAPEGRGGKFSKDYVIYGKLKDGSEAYIGYIDTKPISKHDTLEEARNAMNEYYEANPRMITRYDKVLVIDEIQSKRHQDGREKGYSDKRISQQELYDAQEAAFEAVMEQERALADKYGEDEWASLASVEEMAEYERLRALDEAATNAYENYDKGVPSAPFEKNWAELAMKRMLRYAAENDYDYVAWTTGDQQADRYDIGSVVKDIVAYDTKDADGNPIKKMKFRMNNMGTYNIATNMEGVIVKGDGEMKEGMRLSDITGKPLAEKIMNGEGEDAMVFENGKDLEAKSLEGEELHIGNEGMKAFYDQMLPSFVKKYTKKWGAEVKDITMPDLEENNTMHAVDVTDSMREGVMQGQPKFHLKESDEELAEIEAERQSIIETAKANGTYLKAPNGKKTNLTPEQWVDVRTSRFKKWFGDWELIAKFYPTTKIYSVDEAMESIAILFDKPLTNDAFGFTATISKNKSKKLHSGKAIKQSVNSRLHALAIANIQQLFENAEIDYTHPDTNGTKEIERVHRLGTLMFDAETNALVPVKITAFEYNTETGDKIYSIEAVDVEKIKKPAGQLEDGSIKSPRSPIADFDTKIETLYDSAKEILKNSSKIIDANGEPKVVYHGDRKKARYIFSTDTFFTPDAKYAKRYTNSTGEVYATYLDIKKPFDIRDKKAYDIFTEFRGGRKPVATTTGAMDWGEYSYEDLQEYVEEVAPNEYDGFILDEGADPDGNGGVVHRGLSYVPFAPNQIKSADPVTYDDAGNVIPLSERFNPNKEDIRYALREEAMPFFDEGVSEETEGIEPQRGVITTEEQVRIYLRHKHLKAKQNIRKKYRTFRNAATLDYNERMAERRAKVRSMRTNASKVEYILGEQIEQTLPYEHQAYAKIARGEIKMPWEALAKELGLKKGEKRMYASITRGADKDTTFDSVVHQWWEELDGYEKGIDTQDLRNALISALSTAPSSTKALTELSEIYNREKEQYTKLVDDYDRMEEQELIEEDARNASDMESLANDPTSVVAEYARNASFFNQLEVVDATIMEIRTRLEKTKMMRNHRTKQEYYRTLIDTIAELKQSVKNIITSETIDNLNRNELRRLVDKIDKARSKADIDSVLNDIDAVMLGALIKAQLKNANRMLKLRLPNGMFAEEWINTQVREGRMSRADADAMLREQWKGRNASGVSVAKWVDARTAEVLDRLSRRVASKMALGDKEFSSEREIEEIANRIAELEDKKIDTERGALPAAEGFTEKDAIELDVLSLYEKFLAADVLRKDVADLMDVRSEIEQHYYGIAGKEAVRDVHLEANQQQINDINRQRKELLEEFNDSLLSLLRDGREALAQFRREQEGHKAMVVNMALDAIGEDARLVKTQPKWNEKMQARLRATVNAPYYTFQTVLKEIDHLSPNGEGRFYNYFMESWRDANNAMIDKHASHVETVAYAMARILKVKGRNAADVIQSIINKSDETPLLTITYGGDDAMSGAKRETKVLTLSNALYLMAMWRQAQYRDSMMYHGFTEQMYRQVEAAVRGVGEEYITFIDWVNETLLPNTRLEYNKVHKEMFGTSMAEEKNYFPARLVGTVEKGAIDFNEAGKLPSTITGAVISRVRNRNMIDLNVNYFKILMSHLQEMDQWSSFAPLIRDLNYLAANNKFRDQCNSYMCGINADRGGAGSLFTYFKLTSAIAANCYTPPKVNPVESAILALTRGWAGANISWRFSTALKQLASSPVFAAYTTDPRCAALWAKNSAATFVQQKATLEWAMRVSPMFKKRWEGKFAGMDILDSKVKENGEYSNISVWNQTKVGRGVAKFDDALHKFATDLGMTPNAFVDAMTIANGIKTIYEYEISKWKRQNKGKDVPRNVERKAIMKAEIAFNATQQSSEGAFISEWQAERGIMRALSTYQNSAYGFHRLRLTAANELWRQINNEEYKKRLIEEYGEVEAKAILKDARKTAYAQLMQGSIGEFIFAMMGGAGAVPLFSLLGGDDDEGESWDLFKDAMAGALLNIGTGGYALGSLLNSALSGYEVTLFTAGEELIKDVKELFSTPSLYKALEILGTYRYGVDLQTLTNIATGIDGLIDKASYDDGGAEAVMKILNIPRTQIDMVAGKRKDGETVQEYVTRRLRTEAIGAIPEVDAEGNIIVDDEYWDKFYTPRKSYALKYRKEYETAYRRNVITNIAGVDAYKRYLELEDEYKAVVEAIGWTPDKNPSPETYKKIVTMGGFDDATYKALFPLQKEVAFKAKKTEDFVGTDDNYYELLEQMMESKQKLIDKYNEL